MKNLFLILFIFFITFKCYANCQPKKLIKGELKQTYSTYFDTDSVYSSVLEIDTSLFTYTKLIFKKASNFDTLFVQFYSLDPCNTSNNPISEFHTEQEEVILIYKKEYKYIKVITSGKNVQTFTINIQVFQEFNKCNEHANRYNHFNNPIISEDLQIGTNSYKLCNKNCTGLSPNNSILLQSIQDPIVWAQFPVSNQTILNIEWTDPNFSLLIYGVKNGKSYFIRDMFYNSNWSQFPLFFQFTDYDAIKIGAYSALKNAGTVELLLIKKAIKNSCVNYFDNGHILKVIHTSKNSPKDGPFLYGEEVTYEYKLLDWLPINNNWFHGVHISFGSGWKGFKKDHLNRLVVRFADKIVPHDSIIYNNLVELIKSDSVRVPGFNVKSLILPGFYYKTSNRGPSGPTANYKWGQEFMGVRGTIDDPLFQLKFTLVADSLYGCIPLEGFVKILPVSDYQTGIYEIPGCVETIPVEKPAEIKCCEVSYANSFKDTTMCSGEIFDFTNLTNYAANYQIINTPSSPTYLFTIQPYTKALELTNETGHLDTLLVKVTWGEGASCTDTKEFKIIVKPVIKFRDLIFNKICKNQKINLSKILKENIDNSAYVRQLPLHEMESFTDDNGSIWVGAESNRNISLIVSTENYCDNTLQIRYYPDQCDALELSNNENGIQVKLHPNPTYQTTDLIIENNTESTEWRLNIFDDRGFLIKTTYEYLPKGTVVILHHDLNNYTPGIYYFRLTDNKSNITRKVVKLKN